MRNRFYNLLLALFASGLFVFTSCDLVRHAPAAAKITQEVPVGKNIHSPMLNLEANVCKIHNELLKQDRLRIFYGFAGFGRLLVACQKEEKRYFPNANSYYFAGCAASNKAPKYADVLYCEKCRKAERKCQLIEARKSLLKRAKEHT